MPLSFFSSSGMQCEQPAPFLRGPDAAEGVPRVASSPFLDGAHLSVCFIGLSVSSPDLP